MLGKIHNIVIIYLTKIRTKYKKLKRGIKNILKTVKKSISRKKNKLNRDLVRLKNSHFLRKNINKLLQFCICDNKYFERVKGEVEIIPDSNGCRFYERYDTKIGIIADEFLYNSYKDVALFYPVTPTNYMEVAGQTDVLLVVSAWRGLDNEWQKMYKEGTETNTALNKVIDTYKKAEKKVVFYSKEDPPNYEVFLSIAGKCDFIFTSAKEKIESYKEDCSNENVNCLKFGINPLYHNPIGINVNKKNREVIFSGSWVKKYPERIKEQGIIFDGVLSGKYKLRIIDRCYERNEWSFFFPIKYYKYISPSIKHEYLQKVHKLYDFAINVNSVQNSETMFANRVYELQANGNILISNDSTGVKNEFSTVEIVHSKEQVKDFLKNIKEEEIQKRKVESIRSVMSNHTTFDRVGELLTICGFEAKQKQRNVLIVAKEVDEKTEKMFSMQTYKYKRLCSFAELPTEVEDCDMFCFWDGRSQYGEHYLEDMINAFKYTACDYITKNNYLSNKNMTGTIEREHIYTDCIDNIYATVFWYSNEVFSMISRCIEDGKKSIVMPNGYSIDHFEYEETQLCGNN